MFDVKTDSGLAAFNSHLADNAYATGFSLAGEDACLFAGIGKIPSDKVYPNIARWYRNIASYNEDERKGWPCACPSKAEEKKDAGDDDIDLFGSDDEEDEEKAKIVAQRLKEYAERKAKKGPKEAAKSNVIFDVKPWDDSIDLNQMEKQVRAIQTDGLVWGGAKVLPVAYGVNKLQICCIIEDEKVSTDWLEEQMTALEDLVQSVDVVAFNKV
uniref:Elongation factor 1-beta n=1 Tax=Syphacia muris TaxID=451379 RepID=A0A0N5AJ62_9BILA